MAEQFPKINLFPSIFDGLFFPICFGGDNLQAEMQGEEVPAAAAESSLESQQTRLVCWSVCIQVYIDMLYVIYIMQS